MHKAPALNVMLGIGSRALDARLVALLRALGEHGSLVAAARKAGLSYRHAWGELGRIADALGAPAVALERGRGAKLTKAGFALLELQRALDITLAREWPALATAASKGRPGADAAKPRLLRINASHDFALAALRDLAVGQDISVELHFQGSLTALQELARGNCDVAGFHVAITPPAAAGLGPLARPLRGRSLRFIDLATRSQGLMTPRGKANRISNLGDLTRDGIRFINRQRGSGTRILLDRLLAIEGISAGDIGGYRDEEFTHAAVAATVASGKADVGFGIEAAARAQKLNFIPIADERYLLAARTSTLSTPAMTAFCRLLDGRAFARILSGLPGYAAPSHHEPMTAAQAFDKP